MVEFLKTRDQCHDKFNFGHFFSSPVKLYQRIWIWNLDQNLIIALLIMAVCTVLFWKLYPGFLETRASPRGKRFLFSVQSDVFEIFKMFKNNSKLPGQPVELTQKLAAATAAPQSWYSYSVTLLAIIVHAAVVGGL